MGLIRRLYRNETNFDFIGTRKKWYIASLVIVAICVLSIALKGFNFGIEFAGGTSFVFTKPASVSLSEVEKVVEDNGVEVQTTQEAGSGSDKKLLIKTETLSSEESEKVAQALADAFDVNIVDITVNSVSSSWGKQVTKQGLIALAVFLLLVALYIAIRFERHMAVAALVALVQDLVVTAGIYSLVGFEVTPSTVVGLLTILGYSLYDTVVVFDKLEENTKGIASGSTTTYGEAANLAVNQTLMRSINTSIAALLPVGGLLFVGAGMLGVGTLKDLALVLFVGLAAGAYSSLFIATPIVVDLKERTPQYAALRQRVLAKRRQSEGRSDSHVAADSVTTVASTSSDDDAMTAANRPRGRHGRPISHKRGR